MPKDLLDNISKYDKPTVSAPFNLSTTSIVCASSTAQGYLVDNAGNINFPVLGKIHVAGLNERAMRRLDKNKITPYLSADEKPVVTVRTSSYRVTVIR